LARGAASPAAAMSRRLRRRRPAPHDSSWSSTPDFCASLCSSILSCSYTTRTHTTTLRPTAQGLNWGDPNGSQIRHLLFEIHYLKQILYLTTEIRHLYVGIHRSAQFIFEYFLYALPSVLWRCWLGSRKGIRPVKNGVGVVGFWRSYLSGARCRLAYVPADATATHCLLLQ